MHYKMRRGNRQTLFAVAAIVGAFTVALIITEIIVRLFYTQPILPRFVVDSGVGIKFNQANVRTKHYYPDAYQVNISTNNVGLRGTKNYEVSKKNNTYRIVLLGDSYLFGYGVNDHEVVSHKLEAHLNAMGDGKVYEVLNFGVSGYGTAEELIAYQTIIRPYRPDFVVLFYYSNDLSNTVASNLFTIANGSLKKTGESYLPGINIRQSLYEFPVTKWLFENSQFWNFLRNKISSLVWHHYLHRQGMKNAIEPNDNALELTRQVMLRLLHTVKEDVSHAAVFIIPDWHLESNFPLTRDDISELGITIIDGRNYYNLDDYYPREGHWKPEGHAKAAQKIAAYIGGILNMEGP